VTGILWGVVIRAKWQGQQHLQQGTLFNDPTASAGPKPVAANFS
jgi:hypothetical protein